MQRTLTQGPVGRQLTTLTIPMIWGVFTIIAFNLIDTYYVGQLGTGPLAAMSFTFPVVMTLGSLAMGLGIGASSVIARAIGEGDQAQVQRLTTDSLSLSLLIVAVFVGLGLMTIEPLFTLMGAGPQTLPLIQEYMQVWYWGMVFLVIPMVGNNAIRASGNTLVPSLIMTVAAGANVVLDPILIFGWGTIPAMGLEGAALATVISRAITLVAALLFLQLRLHMLCFNLPSLAVVLRSWTRILRVGIPAAATSMITPISIGLITGLIAIYGPAMVAGFGVASRIESFSLIVLMALSASIGPFVGQNWGAKEYGRVRQALYLSFGFCLIWGLLMAGILAGSAPVITSVFNPDAMVGEVATRYLRIVPISYGAAGIILVASSTFNALGQPVPSVIMTVTRMFFVYLPLAYLGSALVGVNGIFAAACVANLVVGIGAYVWNQRTCSVKASATGITADCLDEPADQWIS